jgi:hypothetical protein
MPNIAVPIGTATWILESEHRTHGGVVIGGTGSGKTCLVTGRAHQASAKDGAA